MQAHTLQVRRYYEDNTRLFLRLGQGTEGTIRRAVWADGVQDRTQAMSYVDDLVLERLRTHFAAHRGDPLKVVDLGCGVGASLCRLAKALPIVGAGITLSGAQVALARRRFTREGLDDRLRCFEADFCELPPHLPKADLAFAIESFVHAKDPAAFFEQAAALIRPGGLLVVCDDFLAHAAAREDAEAAPWLRRFQEGWVLGHLTAEREASDIAARFGFEHVETRDLTGSLELGRPRDRVLAAVMRYLGWLRLGGSYWSMLRGGDALQKCLRRGWVKYSFVVWERQQSHRSRPPAPDTLPRSNP